ncbi:hypothetical protein ACE7GA_17785 [Roseomonas sp. CCTCC AB2023176]|uniref:hypothetical protein n=1 Tax=Roseomonas sp. CCTCC AB2023176 TaxID=3342640 RepID=UPI0035E303DF
MKVARRPLFGPGAAAALPRIARAQSDTRPAITVAVQDVPRSLDPLTQFGLSYVKRRDAAWSLLPVEWMDFRPAFLRAASLR